MSENSFTHTGGTNMKQKTLEERVAALEQRVAELSDAIKKGTAEKDWRSTVGMFSGDEVMKRIDEAGRKWREAERRKAKRKPAKTRKARA
jgi:hypothetical protein